MGEGLSVPRLGVACPAARGLAFSISDSGSLSGTCPSAPKCARTERPHFRQQSEANASGNQGFWGSLSRLDLERR